MLTETRQQRRYKERRAKKESAKNYPEAHYTPAMTVERVLSESAEHLTATQRAKLWPHQGEREKARRRRQLGLE